MLSDSQILPCIPHQLSQSCSTVRCAYHMLLQTPVRSRRFLEQASISTAVRWRISIAANDSTSSSLHSTVLSLSIPDAIVAAPVIANIWLVYLEMLPAHRPNFDPFDSCLLRNLLSTALAMHVCLVVLVHVNWIEHLPNGSTPINICLSLSSSLPSVTCAVCVCVCVRACAHACVYKSACLSLACKC